ncbi:MAG: Trm112 family protein, partial [Geminicoccaceae bacterium]
MTDSAAKPEDTSKPGPASVDPKLLDILVCPLTKSSLRYDRARQELV